MRKAFPSTTRRHGVAYAAAFFYFVGTIFLLLVNIGQVSNRKILNEWYFFRFDVSNIIPSSVPDAALVNSIATTIGLHDYYDVGMWNYCEGYFSDGVTDCSTPVFTYWFNPVAILMSQLLQGANIALPSEVLSYLGILETASKAMFIGFFVAVIASFVATLLAPLAVQSRLLTVPLGLLGWIASLGAILGAGISTGMWTIFSSKLQQYSAQINILPSLGMQMFVFQWLGTAAVVIAAILQTALMCCGTSRRQVRRKSRLLEQGEKVGP